MKLSLLSALLLTMGVTVNAADMDTDHLMFPEDVASAQANAEGLDSVTIETANRYVVADNTGRSTAQRNMKSRRYLTNTKKNKSESYEADTEWVGATKLDDNQLSDDAVRRLNHRFMSRRAFRPYNRN